MSTQSSITGLPVKSEALTMSDVLPIDHHTPSPSIVTVKVTLTELAAALGTGSSTLGALTDIDQTTAGAGKVLANVTSGGHPFSFITPSGGGGTSYEIPAVIPPGSPTTYDDEFTGSTLNSAWTIQNAGTGRSLQFHPTGCGLIEISKLDTTAGMYGISRACPSGAWTIMTSVFCEEDWGQFNGVQLFAGNSSSSNLIFMGLENNESINQGLALAHGHYLTNDFILTGSSNLPSGGPPRPWIGRIFLQLAYDGGSSYSLSISQTGTFKATPNLVLATGGPSAPTIFGIAAMGFGTSSLSRVLVDCFRRTA